MNVREWLLQCLIEECAEVQKEACKCLRFGESNFNPKDASVTLNIDKLRDEIVDLVVIVGALDITPDVDDNGIKAKCHTKMDRLHKYMIKAHELGIIVE